MSNPYTQMAAAFAQFPPSNQAQMLLPWKALSVFRDSECRKEGKSQKSVTRGADPRNREPVWPFCGAFLSYSALPEFFFLFTPVMCH